MHKMTGSAADRFRLKGRGRLAEGNAADVVVFDWNAVRDGADASTDAAPSGIERVFLNGESILDEGEVRAVRGIGQLLLS